MNDEVKAHISNALKKGCRLDGRKPDELRKFTIETNLLSTAEGSARVTFGDAVVLAGVKMAIEKPYPDTPDAGVLMVNSELLPLSNPDFESGPPSIEAIETSRVIDRGIRESGSIDTKKLCIEKGEKVWAVAIDIVPVNYDGNLIDIGGLAAMAALQSAKMPLVVDGVVDYHQKTDKGLDINNYPIPITVGKIGDVFLVDLTADEEKALDVRLTITTLDDKNMCAMQKGGDHPLSEDDINTMIDIAFAKSVEIRKKLLEVK